MLHSAVHQPRSKQAMSRATPTARRQPRRPPKAQWPLSPHAARRRVDCESIRQASGSQMQGIPPRQGRNSRQQRWLRCFRSRVGSVRDWKKATVALLRCGRKSRTPFDPGKSLLCPEDADWRHAAQHPTSTPPDRRSRAGVPQRAPSASMTTLTVSRRISRSRSKV